MCIHGLVYVPILPRSVHWGDLKAITPQQQRTNPALTSWFLNTIFHFKKLGILGKMADSRVGAGKENKR